MKITILDPVDCLVKKPSSVELKWIKSVLSYKTTRFVHRKYDPQEGRWIPSRTEASSKTVLFGTRKSGGYYFGVGLLPRVVAAAEKQNIPLEIEGQVPILEGRPPEVKGVDFRPDQKRLIESAITHQRGVLVSPTGSGKTWLLMGLLSSWSDDRAIILVHTLDIVNQTYEVLKDHGFKGICKVGGGDKLSSKAKIVVATRQSVMFVSKKKPKKKPVVKPEFKKWFRGCGVVIVDECHLWGGEDSQYTMIMRNTLAPIRLGLTGTEPPDGRVQMYMEASLGPVIDQLGYDEAKELDILSDVVLELVPVPKRTSIAQNKTYEDLLYDGIVKNRTRNLLIVERAKAFVDEGISVLVFVDRIEHGDEILDMAEIVGVKAVFVEGDTDDDLRTQIKNKVIKKNIKCVITSKVWREGVNIPNLGAVMLTAGGKSVLSTLQSIGRGLRKVEGKDHAVIVDFLDPYKYLAEHTIQRISLYVEKGWL